MRGKGITYDTGFIPDGDHGREPFEPGGRRARDRRSFTTTCTAPPSASPAAIRTGWRLPPLAAEARA